MRVNGNLVYTVEVWARREIKKLMKLGWKRKQLDNVDGAERKFIRLRSQIQNLSSGNTKMGLLIMVVEEVDGWREQICITINRADKTTYIVSTELSGLGTDLKLEGAIRY